MKNFQTEFILKGIHRFYFDDTWKNLKLKEVQLLFDMF